eukprot:356120-Chlamydomonas_euryale.AAC.22
MGVHIINEEHKAAKAQRLQNKVLQPALDAACDGLPQRRLLQVRWGVAGGGDFGGGGGGSMPQSKHEEGAAADAGAASIAVSAQKTGQRFACAPDSRVAADPRICGAWHKVGGVVWIFLVWCVNEPTHTSTCVEAQTRWGLRARVGAGCGAYTFRVCERKGAEWFISVPASEGRLDERGKGGSSSRWGLIQKGAKKQLTLGAHPEGGGRNSSRWGLIQRGGQGKNNSCWGLIQRGGGKKELALEAHPEGGREKQLAPGAHPEGGERNSSH